MAASEGGLFHTSTDEESQERIGVAHDLYEVEDRTLQNSTSEDEDKGDKSTASIEDKGDKKESKAKKGATNDIKNNSSRIINKN